jgi:hypothetical protein
VPGPLTPARLASEALSLRTKDNLGKFGAGSGGAHPAGSSGRARFALAGVDTGREARARIHVAPLARLVCARAQHLVLPKSLLVRGGLNRRPGGRSTSGAAVFESASSGHWHLLVSPRED